MEEKFQYKGVNDPSSNLKDSWIKDGISDDTPIEWANAFAEYLVTEKEKDKLHHLTDSKGNFKYDRQNKPVYRKTLSTSQLRKFFGDLKSLEANTSSENFSVARVKMMKPKLAYAVGREKSFEPKIKDLYIEFSKAIDAVSEYRHFKNFIQLFEAVVAYHKFYENQ
ncbi:MAG: type III-A CRISPR-associated protein Csm2 [Chitinophagaceae bacterium]|nr:type III-A CRISPR-associated protein Csm2 [Chitinophagaceae bacterium]